MMGDAPTCLANGEPPSHTLQILSVTELLHHHAQVRGARIALSSPKRAVSFSDLAFRTARLAGHFVDAGIHHGDRVAIILGNCVEMVEAICAVARAGAIGVPLDPRSSPAELTTVLKQSRARMIITENQRLDKVRDAAIAGTHFVVVDANDVSGVLNFECLAERSAAHPAPDDLQPNEAAWMHYTSGTTGDRKGVLSSQQSWLLGAYSSLPEFGMTAADHIFWPLPLFSAFGHGACIIAALALGSSVHLPGAAPLLDELLGRPETTVIAGMAPTFQELITAAKAQSRDLPRPRLLFQGGAASSVQLLADVEAAFGSPLLTRYGCTETCGTIAARRPGVSYVEGSCGSPLPGMQVKLVDVSNQLEIHDGEGEIWVRTPSLMLGYDDAIEAPVVEGWYCTGDLGWRGPQDQLIITGRRKELIIRGGQNIHPAEIERVLITCPGVADVVVAGITHTLLGEVPAAFIVQSSEVVDLLGLLDACRTALPDYKVPTNFYEIDTVPYTATGKPQRHLAASMTQRPLTIHGLAVENIEHLVLTITASVCDVERNDQLDPTQPFLELGMHSLAGLVLRDRLVGLTGLNLPATLVYEYPTVRALSVYLRHLLLHESPPQPAQTLQESQDPIAIVSVACRYPGGISSAEDLWQVVSKELDVTSEFPVDRGWDRGIHSSDPDRPGTTSVWRGGFIHNMADFDAGLFGISPREAGATDPQQRLLLETSWELMERGRIAPASLRGSRTGVFVGVMYNDYATRWNDVPNNHEAYLGVGSSGSVASGRISYCFDLRGPSLTLDTACSSSLVAMNLAASALHAGECSLAIAGGVTLMATPRPFIAFSRQRGLSADGRCHSYSADANGTAWSEGVGLLLLERLADAKRNGHRVHGIIRAAVVNSDGMSNGLTAPNGLAQQQLIRDALTQAQLSPDDVDVIEGHGTATALGDPIEARALMAIYGQGRSAPALLGSIKSNLGHTQAAAGVAGIIKIIQAMEHGIAPASLHISQPTKHCDWGVGAIELLQTARPWPENGRARRAAVSAFGIGGTNAHIILEQFNSAAEIPAAESTSGAYPWIISGASEAALRAQAGKLASTLSGNYRALDVAFSLATTRSSLAHRASIKAGSLEALQALAAGRSHPDIFLALGKSSRVVFVFSGQGSQRSRMGAKLCERYPVFRTAWAATCEELTSRLPYPLENVINVDDPLLDRADFAPAAIFAFQVAMCRLLQHFGLQPDYLVGHSIGEVTAAHIAGILTLADAAALISARGKLMEELPSGAMASVMATEDEIREVISDVASVQTIGIAAVNAERSVVVSGTEVAVEAVIDVFRRRGRRNTRLRVSRAYHSPLMQPMLDRFHRAIQHIVFHEPKTPIVSTVTGQLAGGSMCSVEYWQRHVSATVQFRDAIDTVSAAGASSFVEIGASPQLTAHMSAETACSGVEALLDTLGRLHARGANINWRAVFEGSGAHVVDLPVYAFQRRRFWLDPPPREMAKGVLNHPILQTATPLPTTNQIAYSGTISLETHRWLADHIMGDLVMLPATAFVEMALRAGQDIGCTVLEELVIVTALVIPQSGAIQVRVLIDPLTDDNRSLRICSRLDAGDAHDEWTEHASGVLSSRTTHERQIPVSRWTAGTLDIDAAYNKLASQGLGYGSVFRCVQQVREFGDELQALLHLPSTGPLGFLIHPALLDAAMHARLLPIANTAPRLPFMLKGVRLRPTNSSGPFRTTIRTLSKDCSGVILADELGTIVAEVESITTRPWRTLGNLHRLEWIPAETRGSTKAYENDIVIRIEPTQDSTSTLDATYKQVIDLLKTVQEWSTKLHTGTRLIVITECATTAVPNVVHAAAWGLVRSAQAEYGGQLALIDLDGTLESAKAIPSALASGLDLTSLRIGSMTVPNLKALPPAKSTTRLDLSGTVLVTGGTGFLGALLSRHLLQKYGARHVMLVSRSGREAPGATELHTDLVASGADVSIEACDVSDRFQLAALIARVDPPISTVIHAAGVIRDALLESLTPATLTDVLRPKVDAAWHIHDLLPDLPSFVIFSSAAGMLGNRGQANYAAANCFLDALARLRSNRGQPTVSLAWGPWQSESGMAAGVAMNESGPLAPLNNQQGLELFDAAVENVGEAVLVPVISRGRIPFTSSMSANSAMPDKPNNLWREILKDVLPAKRNSSLQLLLRKEVCSALGYDELPHGDLLDLGLDSFTGVLLRNRLSLCVGKRLSATVAFDYPNLDQLSSHLFAQMDFSEPTLTSPHEVDQSNESTNLVSNGISNGTALADVESLQNMTKPYTQQMHSEQPQLNGITAAQASKVSSTSTPMLRLASLYWQLCDSGKLIEASHLIAIASMTLPQFEMAEAALHAPKLQRLASGSSHLPVLLCFPPISPQIPGISMFEGLAREMAKYDMFELPYPETAIPMDFATLAETHAIAIQRFLPSRPIVLIGFSFGGLVAHSVTGRLPNVLGVSMIDTYRPAPDDGDWTVALATSDNARVGSRFEQVISDLSLATMGAYLNLAKMWSLDEALRVPTLFLRCQEPAPQIIGHRDWQASWPEADSTVDLPGHHASVLRIGVHATGRAIQQWLYEKIGVENRDTSTRVAS